MSRPPRLEPQQALQPPFSPTLLETPRVRLCLPGPDAALRALTYVKENREHLAPFEPERPPDFYTLDYWRMRLEQDREDFVEDRALRLLLMPRGAAPGLAPIIGSVSFTQFRRGPLQICELGYGLDHRWQGQGIMTEALQAAIPFVFDRLGFHRIQANHLPENKRSAATLRRLGFSVEGYARDFLRIHGQWRDHVLTALIAPEKPPRR
jgi:ribosomal-protein-alanine N-acetyltransferase